MDVTLPDPTSVPIVHLHVLFEAIRRDSLASMKSHLDPGEPRLPLSIKAFLNFILFCLR